MSIPFIDFSPQHELVQEEIERGFRGVIQKGNFILGEEEKNFEQEFARYCDAKYAVGVNSGTDALYLACAALDITVGDEVILPSFTIISCAQSIVRAGATPPKDAS